MVKLIYTPEEIFAEHDYASPHEEGGYRFHGGFDSNSQYISPRTKNRWPAVKAWQARLQEEGWELLEATSRLLSRPSYPSHRQQKLLLQRGVDRTLWNSITITGIVEARGAFLVEFEPPDMQEIVVENIEDRATGHLSKGLLVTHGLDEAGDPEKGQGGHDMMWFAVRDKVFAKDAHPIPEAPEAVGRPDSDKRYVPIIPELHEKLLLLLMNILMIEVRAENIFNFYCDVLSDAELFTDKRDAAAEAVILVERIRQDEAIHVAYLQTVLSEIRSFKIKTSMGEIPGKMIIDPMWEGMVKYQAETIPDLQREQTEEGMKRLILSKEDGESILEEYMALDERVVA